MQVDMFYFAPAKEDQKRMIHQWLEQQHVREWMHGVGLNNTLRGLDRFFEGVSNTTYWIGYESQIPFAFLITSYQNAETITLDLFICDPKYLGKGLAVPMIRDFLLSQFPHAKTVLIDPEATNTRAIHVYKKVGFKITGEFIASWHPVPHYQMQLEMKDLLPRDTKKIVVVPYNPDWPKLFENEAAKIEKALGSNCVAIHHIGSTAVPGLSAKPVIDMIGVVKNPEYAIAPLENLGFTYKGEYNIPMRYYFNRSEGVEANLHVYAENYPEIELNLTFRDYLRAHPDTRDAYVDLKKNLLKDKASYEKNNSPFAGYNLGKDAFIRNVLKAAHFNRIRILKCAHYAEWEAAKRLRKKHFLGSVDPEEWTFNHKEHVHLILYQGVEIIGYMHIAFLPDQGAAVKMIVMEKPDQNELEGQFLELCKMWLKNWVFSI